MWPPIRTALAYMVLQENSFWKRGFDIICQNVTSNRPELIRNIKNNTSSARMCFLDY